MKETKKHNEKATAKKIRVKVIMPEIYSRVVGYFRPIQNWNRGKQKEFQERRYLKIDKGV